MTGLLGTMLQRRFAAIAHPSKREPWPLPTPLGLHPHSSISPSPVPFVLAEAAGSLLKQPTAPLIVLAVGRMTLFGKQVFRSYLSDGASFVQTVVPEGEANVVEELSFFTLFSEAFPQTEDDIAFLLGRDEVTETVTTNWATGPKTEKRVAKEAMPALIGWPQAQLDDTPLGPLLYERAWYPGGEARGPAGGYETVYGIGAESVATTQLEHYLMAYARETNRFREKLYLSYVVTEDGAVFDIHVGIDVSPDMLNIMKTA